MSIREKDLSAYSEPIRLVNEPSTEITEVATAIENIAEEFGAEVEVRRDEVSRGFFDNEPLACLVIVHPKHTGDYFRFCITRKVQGKTCLFQIFTYGKSTQMSLSDFQSNTKVFDGKGSRGTAIGVLRGGAVGAGFAVGSATAGIVKGGGKLLAKGIAAMMRDDAALAREKDWYEQMTSVFAEVFQ